MIIVFQIGIFLGLGMGLSLGTFLGHLLGEHAGILFLVALVPVATAAAMTVLRGRC